MSRRHGFTLIEMMMVVVIISLTTLMAVPRFRAAVNRSNMLSARAKVMASFATARATAASSGRLTTMHVSGNQVWVTASPRRKAGAGNRDTIVLPKNLSTMYGITASSSPIDTVLVSQTGVGANGSLTSIILSHGNLADTIRISQYGRVLK